MAIIACAFIKHENNQKNKIKNLVVQFKGDSKIKDTVSNMTERKSVSQDNNTTARERTRAI